MMLAKLAFPALMFSGVAFILIREGLRWWIAIPLLAVAGFIAYAQTESRREDDA